MNILPGLSNLLGSKPKAAPTPPPPIPTPAIVADSDEEKRRKEEERLARKRRSGLAATRLTSGGLGDEGVSASQTTLGGA